VVQTFRRNTEVLCAAKTLAHHYYFKYLAEAHTKESRDNFINSQIRLANTRGSIMRNAILGPPTPTPASYIPGLIGHTTQKLVELNLFKVDGGIQRPVLHSPYRSVEDLGRISPFRMDDSMPNPNQQIMITDVLSSILQTSYYPTLIHPPCHSVLAGVFSLDHWDSFRFLFT
jgi:hypothetical protein